MSVFTFLCFTSLLFLSLADPVPPSDSSDTDTALADDSQQLSPADVQAQVKNILGQIEQILYSGLSVILNGVDPEDQDYTTSTTLDCMTGCLNNAVYLRNAAINPQSAVPPPDAVTLTFFSSDASYIPYNLDGACPTGVPDQGTAAGGYCTS